MTITLDHPQRHLARRTWRSLATLAGGLLVGVGLLASVGAVPATIGVLGLFAGWITSEPLDDIPAAELVLAWTILTPLAIGGLRYGLRLLRRHRTLVLFLRRFGHDEAQQAVSFAVLRTIGPSWRIVTLDDAEMAPIGIPVATRRMFRAGALGSKGLGKLAFFMGARAFPVLIWTMVGVLALAASGPAIESYRTGVTSPDAWMEALEPYGASFESVLQGRLPLDTIAPTLPGVFALLATAGLVSFFVLMATLVVLILALPFSSVLLFVSSSAEAAGEAEAAKITTVRSASDVRQAARTIAERSRRVFGPRLVVLRVATPEWQLAVRELASRASIVLLDVSEPTGNVLWELEELTLRKTPYVAIGEYAQVAHLAGASDERQGNGAIRTSMAALLKGREIVAYTTDEPGLKRFARALRGVLLERSQGWTGSATIPPIADPS